MAIPYRFNFSDIAQYYLNLIVIDEQPFHEHGKPKYVN